MYVFVCSFWSFQLHLRMLCMRFAVFAPMPPMLSHMESQHSIPILTPYEHGRSILPLGAYDSNLMARGGSV